MATSSPYLGASSAKAQSTFASPVPPSLAQLASQTHSLSHHASLRHSAPSSCAEGSSSIAEPSPSSATAPSARTNFDPQGVLQPQLSQILSSSLHNERWDKLDKTINRTLSRRVAEVVKARMLEIEPKGFKYIVQVQLVENLGQGGRADLACHWEDTDSVIQEMYANDTLICTVLCFAVQT